MYNLFELKQDYVSITIKLSYTQILWCVGNYEDWDTKQKWASHKIYNVWVIMIIYTNNTVW